MSGQNLPPIHDCARLWQTNDAATMRACVGFRNRQPPGWTLGWLRDSAAHIFAGELKRSALIQAVRDKVPQESQQSVINALDLLLRAIQKHKWQGSAIASCNIEIAEFSVQLTPTGKFDSLFLGKRFLLALQPRAEDVPTGEQFRIWHSALHYEFCTNSSDVCDVMIVDLSKNKISGKRELHELTTEKLPLLAREELNQRLELVASCYRKAIDIVPALPVRSRPDKHPGQKELFRP